MNVTEPEHTQLLMEQPSVPSLIPIQQPLHFVEDRHLGNAWAGPVEEPYSDDDALSEYSSLGRRHYFIDSDFENYNEPCEVIANTTDKFHEEFDNLI